MKEDRYTIYKHISPSGKAYVGMTKLPPEKRWHHGQGYKNNNHFSHAINKYGWDNFKHQILSTNLTLDEACCAEKFLIEYWDLTNQDKGYNIESGGKSGYTVSQETKDKTSRALKGRPLKEATKKKMSVAHDKTKRKVVCIDKKTKNIRRIYDAIREAARETGVDRPSIRACCNGTRKSAGGYIWRYAE